MSHARSPVDELADEMGIAPVWIDEKLFVQDKHNPIAKCVFCGKAFDLTYYGWSKEGREQPGTFRCRIYKGCTK